MAIVFQPVKKRDEVVDAYAYAKDLLNQVLMMLDKPSASVCKSCYDLLAYIRAVVDLYTDPEKRAELVKLYNNVLSRVDASCRGIREVEEVKKTYERAQQVVQLSEKASFDMCRSYFNSVMDWWESMGYKKDMNALLNYFFNRLEGTKSCEEFADHMRKWASERGFK